MKHSKLIAKIVGTLIIIAGLVAYWILPSWQQRAAYNLNAIHRAIDNMHPAVLDPSAKAFHEWHTQGYEQAKALLPLVKSPADEYALLRFYFAGYLDPHINFYGSHQYVLQRWHHNEHWTGWLLKYSNAGYQVIYSLPGNDMPPEGATLLRCDELDIDAFLQQHYAPYFDRRWNIPLARDKAAQALTVESESNDISMLNRPAIKQCEFLNPDGTTASHALHWQTIKPADWTSATMRLFPDYSLPSVHEFATNSFWINVSDFQLRTPAAYAAQQTLLKSLDSLTNVKLVVLDLRANGGGSDLNGDAILSHLFKDGFAFLSQQDLKIHGQPDALFRVSQYTLWSEEARLAFLKSVQGENSLQLQFLSHFVENYRAALNNGKSYALQSKLDPTNNTGQIGEVAPPASWHFPGKVILVTSENCVSACLDFVDLVKLIPGVLQVGETTNADTVYTEVAGMRETYYGENVYYMVPIKKNFNRSRADNVPYIPDVAYDGNINDTPMLQKWILDLAKTRGNN